MIKGAFMSEHLLYISIGPVQEFIASARKCQDLWYGSYLLSQLSETCADAIQKAVAERSNASGTPLIFPAELSHLSTMESMVANKILVEVPSEASDQLHEIALAGENAVKRRLYDEANLAFKKLKDQPNTFFKAQMADAQLDELIEYAWVALPVTDYRGSRVDADAVLAARKSSKEWSQIRWNQGLEVPKSSLDGARESVIDEKAYDVLSQAQLRQSFGVKKGERLCGVGLLKRLGAIAHDQGTARGTQRQRPAFHSTSHLAAAPLLTSLAGDKTKESAIATYIEELEMLDFDLTSYKMRVGGQVTAPLITSLRRDETRESPRAFAQAGASLDKPIGYDGYLLYESRLKSIMEDCLRGYDAMSDSKINETLRDATNALKTCLKSFDLSAEKLSKYYGFILADGDHMGAAIDALETPEQHRELSRNLSTFAQNCRALIEGHGGSLLYAGGDDVLALVPLHTAIDASCGLQQLFTECMTPFFSQPEIARLTAQNPTLSVGLSVAHHMDSMSYALNLARRAERQAKEAGRDRLSIVVSRRSGGEYTATGTWRADSGLPDHLRALLKLNEAEALPHGVAHELIRAVQVFSPLGTPSPSEERVWREECRLPLWREVRRILKRKRIAEGKEYATEAQKTLMTYLEPFTVSGAPPLDDAVRQLSDEMLIAKLIYRSYQNAWSKA
jgi:CRISPR-associated protein Cmr2